MLQSAFFRHLPVNQYEHHLTHSFSSPGRGSDVHAVKTIGQAGPRGWGLHTHRLPRGFYRVLYRIEKR